MGTIQLIVRVALACVFAVSASAKLLDRDGTRQAVAGFGVQRALVGAVSLAIAPAEIVVAALLLPDPTAPLGLVLALVLLAAFTIAVLWALRTGRVVDCHCFGRLGGADISGRTVARNAVLMVLTVIGIAGIGHDAARRPLGVLLGLVLAAGVIAAEYLLGRAARARRYLADETAFEEAMAQHPDDRAAAPDFRLPTLAGGELSLQSLLQDDLPLLVIFMMPACGPCKAMHSAVVRWADAYSARVRVVVMTRYSVAANLEAFAEVRRLDVLVDEDAVVNEDFGVRATPSAVLVGSDGRLRGGLASGELLVRRLLAAALSGNEPDLASSFEETGTPAESLSFDSVVRPRHTVTSHQADGLTVLVDEETGAGATLDQIGGVVWPLLDGRPLADVVSDLADTFDTPAEVVGPDVLTMVRALGRAGVVDGVAAEPISEDVDSVSASAPTT